MMVIRDSQNLKTLIQTKINPNDAQDTDNDGTPDYFDTDDDGDGILTIEEGADPLDGNPTDATDSDQDGIPDYLDPDDDKMVYPPQKNFIRHSSRYR